jgi:hypothetical protein
MADRHTVAHRHADASFRGANLRADAHLDA